jgi:hypothetical protein
MTIEQIYETKGASYMEWLKENGGKREYRILEEKYPSHSLWYPQFKDEGRDWTHFTIPGRPYDRRVEYRIEYAQMAIRQDRDEREYTLEKPEIIYHEVK